MRVACTISVGSDDTGLTYEVTVEDEAPSTPERIEDIIRRAGDHVLRMYEQTHAVKER